MQIMLWGLQSPINIGMILRTAEIYRVEVGIFDRYGVLNDPATLATISDFASGAWNRQRPSVFTDPAQARGFAKGRHLATAITQDAAAVQNFAFRPTDCVYVGNEYDGLPDPVMLQSDIRVTIPMPPGYLPKPPSASPIDPRRRASASNDGMPNLNVAVASSIIMFVSSTLGAERHPAAEPNAAAH